MPSFGPFSISEGSLTRQGRPVAVGRRGIALLTALADAKDRSKRPR